MRMGRVEAGARSAKGTSGLLLGVGGEEGWDG